MTKGFKSTEFWITALSVVGGVAGSIVGFVPVAIAAPVVAVGGAAYAIARGLAKMGKPQ